ncbi:hypothetical protein EPUL_003271, partial [Erysiphe pulchra]
MLFSLAKVALTLIVVTKTASTGLEQVQSTLTQPAYYDCGSWIFNENLIQVMLNKMGTDIDILAVPFIELLYDLELGYWKIDIPKDLGTPKSSNHIRQESFFYLILSQSKQIVDVVIQMTNGHYIKCKRVDKSMPQPTNTDQNEYGYECGHDLFSHEVVQMSADLALSNWGRSKLYPAPYHGPLYLPKSDYWIFPLSREMKEHQAGRVPEHTYLVVINPAGKVIDVVAELMQGDYIKCVRTTKVPPDFGPDQDLRLGYSCGLEFFDINHIKRTAKFAMSRMLQKERRLYPKIYKDNSIEGFIFPLLPHGRFYILGHRSYKHFIVTNLNFSFQFAVARTSKGLVPCEESLRGIEVVPLETDDFRCTYSKTNFENERLLELVEIACKSLGTRSKRFPAIYNGPVFNIPGPYLTWPIKPGNTASG